MRSLGVMPSAPSAMLRLRSAIAPLRRTIARPQPRGTCSRSPGAEQTARRSVQYLARTRARTRVREIDNRERHPLRAQALGRARALPRRRAHRARLAGCDNGAENWACIASLVETCKLNGADPQAYLTDVLTKLVNLWPASCIDQLMPWA
jgi:hypothetical protein